MERDDWMRPDTCARLHRRYRLALDRGDRNAADLLHHQAFTTSRDTGRFGDGPPFCSDTYPGMLDDDNVIHSLYGYGRPA